MALRQSVRVERREQLRSVPKRSNSASPRAGTDMPAVVCTVRARSVPDARRSASARAVMTETTVPEG